jgi:hypothetical protein
VRQVLTGRVDVAGSISVIRSPSSYADVRDQGSDWRGDLADAAQWPHGLYLLSQIADRYGASGGRRGRTVWFTVGYPAG